MQNTFNSNVNSKSFIAGTVLCSVVSALIAKLGLHDELALRPAAYHLESPLIELPLYLGLGVVAGLVAVMFKFFSRKVMPMFCVLSHEWVSIEGGVRRGMILYVYISCLRGKFVRLFKLIEFGVMVSKLLL